MFTILLGIQNSRTAYYQAKNIEKVVVNVTGTK